MKTTVSVNSGKTTVFIAGRIDTLTSETLEKTVLPLINDKTNSIILDCTDVDYISSAGLRIFILADKKSHAYNGTITIAGLTEFCKDIFNVSGLTNLFNFV